MPNILLMPNSVENKIREDIYIWYKFGI